MVSNSLLTEKKFMLCFFLQLLRKFLILLHGFQIPTGIATNESKTETEYI